MLSYSIECFIDLVNSWKFFRLWFVSRKHLCVKLVTRCTCRKWTQRGLFRRQSFSNLFTMGVVMTLSFRDWIVFFWNTTTLNLVQHCAEDLVFFLAFINGQLIVVNTDLPDVYESLQHNLLVADVFNTAPPLTSESCHQQTVYLLHQTIRLWKISQLDEDESMLDSN